MRSNLPRVPVLFLPNTMAHWPWPRAINPHYEEAKAASNAWFESFNPFTPQSQIAFDKCDFGKTAFICNICNRK